MGNCSRGMQRHWLAGSAAIICMAVASPAIAQTRTFDVPAQDASRAIPQFAKQAGVQVLAPAREVRGKRTRAVKGSYSVPDGLRMLLDGSGLEIAPSNGTGIVTIRAARQTSRPVADTTSSAGEDDSSGTGEDIVVTGTNLKGSNKTIQVSMYSRDDIEKSGASTTQEFFRTLPQNFSGGSGGLSEDGNFGAGALRNTNSGNANAVNLRGVGETSTLVLVDGHRVAPSDYGLAVDLSLIPVSAIDRVDVLPDGASAIYGSDAIGGVVNIVLRKDYEGAETRLRYGDTTKGGRRDYSASQLFGAEWDTGGLLISGQLQHQDRLRASQRSDIAELPEPNDLYPSSDLKAGLISLRQEVSESLKFHTSASYAQRDTERDTNSFGSIQLFDSRARNVNAFTGAELNLFTDWSAALDLGYSQQKTTVNVEDPSYTAPSKIVDTFDRYSVDGILRGSLGYLAAGNVRAAFGASYRDDRFNEKGVFLGGIPAGTTIKRRVTAAFGEIYVPVFGEANAVPLLRALELSAAVRHDHYSDFGSTTNPKFGLYWSPAQDWAVRSSYGTSFRAPAAIEVAATQPPAIAVFDFDAPGGGVSPVLTVFGGLPLGPETAKTFSAAVEYTPRGLEGLRLSASFYSISYKNRIVTPPFDANALINTTAFGSLITPLGSDEAAQAYVDQVIAQGGQFFGTSVAGVRNILDLRQRNAASLRQTGLDIDATFAREMVGGRLSLQATATVVNHIRTKLADGATALDQVDTFGNPPSEKYRFQGGWAAPKWSVFLTGSHVGGYANTTQPSRPKIKSWTTFDLTATLDLANLSAARHLKGTSLRFIGQNVFGRKPPYVDASGALVPVRYDVANANPLGRVLAIELVKQW